MHDEPGTSVMAGREGEIAAGLCHGCRAIFSFKTMPFMYNTLEFLKHSLHRVNLEILGNVINSNT